MGWGLVCLSGPLTATAVEPDRAEEIRRAINTSCEQLWQDAGLSPAGRAEEGVLLRRLTLDLLGRVPSEAEIGRFFALPDEERYTRTVDALIREREYHAHLAVVLRRWWLPQLSTQQYAHLVGDYEAWLSRELSRGRGFDALVSAQLTSPVGERPVPPDPRAAGTGSPIFLAAADFAPERIAANSTRAFLGLNMDCAQCHAHPFSRWSQEDFWKMAAWFSREGEGPGAPQSRPTILIPDTTRRITADFFDGASAVSGETGGTFDFAGGASFQRHRRQYAGWLTDEENEFFALNAVNGIWAAFFGRGLVEPRDDLTAVDTRETGALLRRIAAEFRSSGFQTDALVRAIVTSRPYQLESLAAAELAADEERAVRLFAARRPRLISAEQLTKSLRTISASGEWEGGRSDEIDALSVADPTGFHRSTLQSLLLLNGDMIHRVCAPKSSPYLRSLAAADYLSGREKIASLFQRTLGRIPTDEESVAFAQHFAAGEASGRGEAERYGDLLWLLINAAEFSTIR
jgi:hypothetical protein